MATKPAVKQAPTRTQMDVFLGKIKKPLGRLIFVKDGQREFSQFAYSDDWLADAQFFDISPDLNSQSGFQLRFCRVQWNASNALYDENYA